MLLPVSREYAINGNTSPPALMSTFHRELIDCVSISDESGFISRDLLIIEAINEILFTLNKFGNSVFNTRDPSIYDTLWRQYGLAITMKKPPGQSSDDVAVEYVRGGCARHQTTWPRGSSYAGDLASSTTHDSVSVPLGPQMLERQRRW